MKSSLVKKILVAAGLVAAMAGVSGWFGEQSQAGNSYSSTWSKSNAPEFYGTVKMTLQKGTKFSLNDARVRTLARDFEDGDLTNKIQLVSNDVNTAKVGEYEIVYSVADSHGNVTKQTVPVSVVENEDGNYFEKKLYALPATGYMTVTGARGNQMDRQVLGPMLAAGQKVEIKRVSGSAKVSLYAANGALAGQKSVSNEWQSVTAGAAGSLLAETPVGASAVVAVRMAPEVTAVPYYHYGDDEAVFRAGYTGGIGIVEGQSVMFYLTGNDKVAAWQGLSAGLASFDKLVAAYDQLLGYEFDSREVWNQNVRAKYFVRGGGNCSGTAAYTAGAVMLCGAGTATSAGFKLNEAMAHAVAHGYAGTGLTDDEIDADTATNVLVHYVAKHGAPAGSFAYAGPRGDTLTDLVEKLENAGYVETYSALAQLTRQLNTGGTLAEHSLAERYKTVLGEEDEENPGEEEPGEEDNTGEDEPGNSENEEGGEKPGDEKPTDFEEQPDKEVFTVVAEGTNKNDGATTETADAKKPAGQDGNVVLSVVATTAKNDSGSESEQRGDDAEETAEAQDAAGEREEAPVTESLVEPRITNEEAKEIVEEKKDEDNGAVYVVAGLIIAVVVAGMVYLWVREK